MFNTDEISVHANICPFAPVTCVACGDNMKREALVVHEKEHCPKRSVPCPWCTELVIADTLQQHNEQNEKKHFLVTLWLSALHFSRGHASMYAYLLLLCFAAVLICAVT